MEKKSFILGFILAIVAFGLIALASAEDWNLGNPVTVQNQNVTGKQNLTFLPENAIVIIGAGGNVTSDVANLTYYTANQTLVVKFLKGDGNGLITNTTGIMLLSPATTQVLNQSTDQKNYMRILGSAGASSGLPSSGTGMELGYASDTEIAYIQIYNRTGAAYKKLIIDASVLGLNQNTLGVVGIGTGTVPSGGGTPVLVLAQASALPTGLGSNTIAMVGVDSGGTTEAYLCDEAGNCQIQTPHNNEYLNNFSSEYYYPWVFESSNPYIGRKTVGDMEGLFRLVENLTGKQLLYTENINKLSWSELEDWRESTENNKSRDAAVQAWLRNASELEVLPSLAFEFIWDNKTITTGKVIGNTTEYSFDENGTVIASIVPIFETKVISKQKKKLKADVTFDKKTGNFYRKPTKAEAEAAVGGNYSHYIKQAPPKWMQDRGVQWSAPP